MVKVSLIGGRCDLKIFMVLVGWLTVFAGGDFG